MEIVDLLLDDQPRDADAGHPAAAAYLNGVVDAFLVDAEVVRNRVDGDPLSGGYNLPECSQSGRIARREAQFQAVGVVDDHPFGIEQGGVTAAGRALRHVGVDFRQREIDAANVFAARLVRHAAGHAPDLDLSRAADAAADRVAVSPGDELLPEIRGGLRGPGLIAAWIAADRTAPRLREPDASRFRIELHQRRREYA